MAETRTAFPPHELTDSERAATVGRFVMSPETETAPEDEAKFGRTPAAPQGVVYVRDPDVEIEDATDAPPPEPPETAELGSTPDAGPDTAEPGPEVEPETEEEESEDEEAEEESEEAEPEAEADDEVDVESLTVPELQAQLDAFGVEYDRHDLKADLQQKLYDALG